MVDFTLDKLDEILGQLKKLPKIKEAINLRKRLEKEKEKLVPQVKEITVPTIDKKIIANQKRSSKQKRNWHYAKLIRNYFPEKPILEIRREIAKRKRGEGSSISDAVYQNPSP
ncbi:MAG: hypothetical protein KGI28_00535 [Thaumarchaeota archaeon]|nr:hypothetical protein [Nitrososphaerota archaeon]